MKILFLQKRLLFPSDVGVKIRTLNVVRHLAQWHDVTYLCNIQTGEEPHAEAMRGLGVRLETIPWREVPRGTVAFYRDLALNLLSQYPFNVNKDFDPRLRKRAVELVSESPYDLLVCDFVQMARNALGLTGPPKLLFQHNVEAEIFRRHAQQDPGWLRRRYLQIQWRKMHRFEGQAGRAFDAVVAVSRRDREAFEADYGWNHVRTIDTAVDLDYFRPVDVAAQPYRCVFVGSMDWLPNQDGVRHFVDQIWPRIRLSCPAASFQIVGRNPPASLKRLEQAPGVEVVGTVPDVRPYIAAASVVVVPLLVGGGTRLKIYEAMAMERAVVSTSLGAEGLDVTPGEHLITVDQAEQFADAVVALLENPERRERLARQARETVTEKYSSERVARQFESICRETVAAASGGKEPDSGRGRGGLGHAARSAACASK